MPQTTLVASSWAMTLPPAATMSSPPRCRRCPCRSGSAPSTPPATLRPRRRTADRPRACRNARPRRHRARSRLCRRGAPTRMWRPPGREIDVAGLTGSPSTPSRTGRRPARLRCSARMVVKVAGMCWVIRTGRGRSRRRARRPAFNACGPPVEAPISSTRGGIRPKARLDQRRLAQRRVRQGCAACRPAAPARVRGGRHGGASGGLGADARIFSISSRWKVSAADASRGSGLRDVVGGAERQRLQLTSAWSRVSAEAMMTTRSRSASSFGKVEMPSSSGISTSSTTTSGRAVELLDRLAAVAQRGRRLPCPLRVRSSATSGYAPRRRRRPP